jgi:hypothetical protein
MVRRIVLAAVLLTVGSPAQASAAPPPNDARATPQTIVPPAVIGGTTAESTLESDEPGSCQALRGSLFYEFRAVSADRVVVRLQASGDLDATVEIFVRTRSQLGPVGCETTDTEGQAALDFRPVSGQIYLIRVGQRSNSQPGSFQLEVFAPEPPPQGPGRALPRAGASGTLDSLAHTSDAYSHTLREGTTYRLNVSASACVRLGLYAPGTRNFDAASPMMSSGCDGYLLFTPSVSGRYSLLLQAQARHRGPQRYHLQVARSSGDDSAPGLPLPNLTSVRGSLAGTRVDAVDLYRFSVAERSSLELSLGYSGTGSAVVSLYTDNGGRLGRSESELARTITPGRYFVSVRTTTGGTGRYTLRRVSRTITRTTTTIAGRRSARSAPGEAVPIAATVTPGVAGPVAFTIERFDPLAGWQFFRTVRGTVAKGRAQITFTPPWEGRWRAMAAFAGTRTAAPSQSGFATLLTAPPLEGRR